MAKAQGVVQFGQRIVAFLAIIMFTWATVGCAKPTEPTVLLTDPTEEPHLLSGPIAEVSPPETLDTLKQIIDAYTPQVRILSPRPGEVVESSTVSVRFQVRGLPLFKDETWQLGPHLHVFLDDEPYQAVYDASEALVLKDLAPGTHTLRVFASRPWHESFKNDGAFDQRTFHIFAPTPQNEVNASAPLLTYSRPQGTYGAEPIMLDFYLTNAPLHLSAQADPKDDLHDWRIRCTVNGQSFVFDQWQPIYLKGFQPGRNWVQLELIDETGRPIENRFNNTVRIIDYQPGGTDTLSRLVRGELDLKAVASIIDPTYTPPAPPSVEQPKDAIKATETQADEETATPEDVAPAEPESPLTAPVAEPAEEPQPGVDAGEPTPTPAPSAWPNPEPFSAAPALETADEEPASPEETEAPETEAAAASPTDVAPTADSSSPEDKANAAVEDPDDQSEPVMADEPLTLDEPTSEAVAEPEAAPAAEAVPSQPDFTAAASQPETQTPPLSAMERGKGMVNRWKNWAQQQTLPGFGTAQPEASPEPSLVPIYETPEAADALDEAAAAETSPSSDIASPMTEADPDEPYLPEAYMTEPRMDVPSVETPGAATDEAKGDTTYGNEASRDAEPFPQANDAAPRPLQPNPPKRPSYI